MYVFGRGTFMKIWLALIISTSFLLGCGSKSSDDSPVSGSAENAGPGDCSREVAADKNCWTHEMASTVFSDF